MRSKRQGPGLPAVREPGAPSLFAHGSILQPGQSAAPPLGTATHRRAEKTAEGGPMLVRQSNAACYFSPSFPLSLNKGMEHIEGEGAVPLETISSSTVQVRAQTFQAFLNWLRIALDFLWHPPPGRSAEGYFCSPSACSGLRYRERVRF